MTSSASRAGLSYLFNPPRNATRHHLGEVVAPSHARHVGYVSSRALHLGGPAHIRSAALLAKPETGPVQTLAPEQCDVTKIAEPTVGAHRASWAPSNPSPTCSNTSSRWKATTPAQGNRRKLHHHAIDKSIGQPFERLEGRIPAFAFDIDGVLVRGGDPIEGLQPMFDKLNHAYSFRIPHVFLTNGGGYAESVRARRLSELTGTPVSEDQVIQAHTVLQELVPQYADRPVLVLGGSSESKVRTVHDVMCSYGFKNFTLGSEIHAWRSDVWPFHEAPEDEPNQGRQWLREHAERRHRHHEAVPQRRFEAVIVFHDSRDWGGDIQLICDVLRSPTGQLGMLGDDTHPQVPLFFTHEDLIWTNSFPTPRFGQGAFQLAARAVYQAASGRELQSTSFGKPHHATYAFANKKLRGYAKVQGLEQQDRLDVWMIGDNPGANAFGWKSALVETGVYVPGTRPAFQPTLFAPSAEKAIERILAQYDHLS